MTSHQERTQGEPNIAFFFSDTIPNIFITLPKSWDEKTKRVDPATGKQIHSLSVHLGFLIC